MTQQQLWDEFAALPDEAQRQVADFVAFLRGRYAATPPVSSLRAEELEAEPFVGMWRDREELEDSSAWVRQTRKSPRTNAITGSSPA